MRDSPDMSESKPFASLKPTLLARKGGAKPAMRPQLHHRTDYAASMIDGRTVMEIDPNGRSSQEIVSLWNYVSDRLEKNFRRTVFASPGNAAAIPGVQRPVGGFGRRVVGS